MNNEVEVKSAKVQELEAVAAKCWEPVKARRSEIETVGQFWFTPAEALGFCEALIVSFREIAFGK